MRQRQLDQAHQADHRVAAIAAGQRGVVTALQTEGAGVTRGRLAYRVSSGASRAVAPGVYLWDAAKHPPTWQQLPLATRVQTTLLLHGPESEFCLDTAARIHGIGGVGLDHRPICVQLPPGRERHQVPGIEIHTRVTGSGDVTRVASGQWSGLRVTSPSRTVLDLVLESAASMREPLARRRNRAVAIGDSALNRGLVTLDSLAEAELAARRRRGVAIARPWWRLMDARSESPLETDVRLIASDGGMPPDELQLPVYDRGGVLIGYGDLAWRLRSGLWLVAEADGAEVHEHPEALFRDRRRANAFVATGQVVMIRFTYADTRRPDLILSELARHLRPAA